MTIRNKVFSRASITAVAASAIVLLAGCVEAPPPRAVPGWAFPAFFALFAAVWSVRATVGFNIDRALDPSVSGFYSGGIKIALWAVPAAAFAYWIRGESRLTSLKLRLPAARTLPLTIAIVVAYLSGVAFDVARKHGVSEATLYNWKAKYGGMDVSEAKRLTPAAYAANLSATCDRLRNPDQLRRSHIAPPAPHGVKPAEALIAAG